MPLTLLFLVAFLSVCAGILSARHMSQTPDARDLPRQDWFAGFCRIVTLSGGFVLIPLLLICWSDRLCQSCPLWLQHHARTLTWLVGLPSILFALTHFAALMIRSDHPQRRFVLRAAVLLSFVLLATAWRSNSIVDGTLRTRETEDGIVLQSTSYTCVAASLANVARLNGLDVNERDAARLLQTTRSGSRWGSARYVLSQMSIGHEDLNGRFRSLSDVPAPAILWVDHPLAGRESHALLFRRRVGDRFELWEPMGGRLIMSDAEVREFWHGNGIACRIDSPRHSPASSAANGRSEVDLRRR